jgi:hypothetical protein
LPKKQTILRVQLLLVLKKAKALPIQVSTETLQAWTIRCIEKAWRRVSDKTIHNCFRHGGILSAQGVNVTEIEDDVEVEAATTAAADDDLPLSEWVRKIVMCWNTMSMTRMQQ